MSKRKTKIKDVPEEKKNNNPELISNSQEIVKKSLKNQPKIDRIDRAIVTIKKHSPNLTVNAVAQKLQDVGIIKSKATVYKRYKKSNYLQAEFEEVENFHREKLVRETYPIAEKRVQKALKNKDLSEKEAFPYVKLVYDKVHGETHKHIQPAGVNISSIQNAQFILQADLHDDDDQKSTKNDCR